MSIREPARLAASLGLATAAVLLLAGCRSSSPSAVTAPLATPNRLPVASGIPRQHAPQVISLTVHAGAVEGGARVFQVVQDSRVQLDVVADVTARVSVAGYSVDALTSPGAAVQLNLVATRAGDFQVRLADQGLLLATLHVA